MSRSASDPADPPRRARMRSDASDPLPCVFTLGTSRSPHRDDPETSTYDVDTTKAPECNIPGPLSCVLLLFVLLHRRDADRYDVASQSRRFDDEFLRVVALSERVMQHVIRRAVRMIRDHDTGKRAMSFPLRDIPIFRENVQRRS